MLTCGCGKYGLGLLPIVLTFVTCGCFLATYLIAAHDGHVSYKFPYISDTGAKPPESCIFTFFLSISSFLAAIIMFIRYRQIAEYNREDTQRVLCINTAAFYLGLVSPLGMLIVASFQDVNAMGIHVLGAAFAFGFGCVYAWMHTYLTYRIHASTQRILDVRFLLSLAATAALIVAAAYAEIALLLLRGKFSEDTALHWKPGDGGYKTHIVSAVAEWCVGLAFLGFFLTFTGDFSRIVLDVHIRLQLNDPLLVSSGSGSSDIERLASPYGDNVGQSSPVNASETVPLLNGSSRSGSGPHSQKFNF